MRLLLIGGAGRVGEIVRPALEAEHTCHYLDVRPVPDAEDRTIVADVNDDDAMQQAVQDTDAIVYMALGAGEPFSPTGPGGPTYKYSNPDAAMNVNVLGLYRALHYGILAGVRQFVHSSSLSVYDGIRPYPVDESCPMTAWKPYGISKRLGEVVCQAMVERCPELSVTALRLMLPYSDAQWEAFHNDDNHMDARKYPLGPKDAQRLYLAAVQFKRPGFYPVQASGDVAGHDIPHHRAAELLGWTPRGE